MISHVTGCGPRSKPSTALSSSTTSGSLQPFLVIPGGVNALQAPSLRVELNLLVAGGDVAPRCGQPPGCTVFCDSEDRNGWLPARAGADDERPKQRQLVVGRATGLGEHAMGDVGEQEGAECGLVGLGAGD